MLEDRQNQEQHPDGKLKRESTPAPYVMMEKKVSGSAWGEDPELCFALAAWERCQHGELEDIYAVSNILKLQAVCENTIA